MQPMNDVKENMKSYGLGKNNQDAAHVVWKRGVHISVTLWQTASVINDGAYQTNVINVEFDIWTLNA